MSRDGVTIAFAGREWRLSPDDGLGFGRDPSCAIVLDGDPAISRDAGAITWARGCWWVTNRSGKRPLELVDPRGVAWTLPPGAQHAITTEELVVAAVGLKGRHALTVRVDIAGLPTPVKALSDLTGATTRDGSEVVYTDEDRKVLTAMFAGYLEVHPAHDPTPATYADAAEWLGWPASATRRRVERIRERLTAAGVPDLSGARALDRLAEHVLTAGVITGDDLDDLKAELRARRGADRGDDA